jgi:hypothetical protein
MRRQRSWRHQHTAARRERLRSFVEGISAFVFRVFIFAFVLFATNP